MKKRKVERNNKRNLIKGEREKISHIKKLKKNKNGKKRLAWLLGLRKTSHDRNNLCKASRGCGGSRSCGDLHKASRSCGDLRKASRSCGDLRKASCGCGGSPLWLRGLTSCKRVTVSVSEPCWSTGGTKNFARINWYGTIF